MQDARSNIEYIASQIMHFDAINDEGIHNFIADPRLSIHIFGDAEAEIEDMLFSITLGNSKVIHLPNKNLQSEYDDGLEFVNLDERVGFSKWIGNIIGILKWQKENGKSYLRSYAIKFR